MTPERKRIIILAVLGVALVCALAYTFLFSGGPTPLPPAPKDASKAAGGKSATPTAHGAKASTKPAAAKGGAKTTASAAGDNEELAKMAEANVDIDELLKNIQVVNFDYELNRIDRDPMTPLVGIINSGKAGAAVQPPTVVEVLRKKVTGIIYDKNPVAVVDDEVVSVGHTYPSGVQIQAIEPNRVVFKVGDSLVPVEMKEK